MLLLTLKYAKPKFLLGIDGISFINVLQYFFAAVPDKFA